MMIGAGAVVLLVTRGRLAGISGICAGLLAGHRGVSWRAAFVAGLLVAGLLGATLFPSLSVSGSVSNPSTVRLVIAGVLVGIGARVGGGCTSGHGVCGIGRLSKRSVVATIVFMSTAMVTVAVERGVS